MSDPAKAAGRPRRSSHVSSELPEAGVDGIDACTARVEECVGEATGGGTDVDGDSGDEFQRELAAGVCKLERVSERFGPLEQLDGGVGPHEGIGVRDCATVEYAARRDERRGSSRPGCRSVSSAVSETKGARSREGIVVLLRSDQWGPSKKEGRGVIPRLREDATECQIRLRLRRPYPHGIGAAGRGSECAPSDGGSLE
ncbi:MAG: hypothetical protein M0T79_12220 [Actinomycetota bacterium]|nr:hypothetical protein [Actinomycetota bacterium]